MKRILFLLLITLLPATVLADYDINVERTFDGVVVGVPHLFDRLMYFTLKTPDRLIEVQLGPKDFVESSKLKFKTGDMVTVVGVPALLGRQEALLAREIRAVKAVFTVRDRNGAPLWDTDRPVEMDIDVDDSGEPVMCKRIEP